MVIRLGSMVLRARWSPHIDWLAAMEDHILALPYLRTVTLETIDANESAEAAEKLPSLRASGKLRRRTCKEAWVIAQEALRNPVADAKIESVVSPLWYSDEYQKYERDCWCVALLCLYSFFTCIYLISSSCRLERSDKERKKLQKKMEEARRKAAEAQARAARRRDEMAASAQIGGSSNLDRPHLPVAESEVVQ